MWLNDASACFPVQQDIPDVFYSHRRICLHHECSPSFKMRAIWLKTLAHRQLAMALFIRWTYALNNSTPVSAAESSTIFAMRSSFALSVIFIVALF